VQYNNAERRRKELNAKKAANRLAAEKAKYSPREKELAAIIDDVNSSAAEKKEATAAMAAATLARTREGHLKEVDAEITLVNLKLEAHNITSAESETLLTALSAERKAVEANDKKRVGKYRVGSTSAFYFVLLLR
jgi:hypothetical protein